MNKCFFGVLLLINFAVWGQVKNKGIPFIKNYTQDEYHASAKNFITIQDQRGVMYFANENGILEYDGTYWNLIKIKGDAAVSALSIDQSNRIYAGIQGNFGYLQPNKKGEMQYISISDRLKGQNIQAVLKILPTHFGIVFLTQFKIYIWQNNQFQIISSENSFDQMFYVNQTLFVREWGRGLLQFKNGKFEKVKSSELFEYDRITTMLPYQQGKILLCSRNKGFFIFNTDSKAQPIFEANVFTKEVNDFVIEHSLQTAAWVNDQQIALGTAQKGILILSKKGTVLQHIHQAIGLKNNAINDILLDQHKNAWICMDEGIAHIEINSPFSIFNQTLGLNGRVNNSILFDNKLYVGTSQGVFYQNWDNYLNPLMQSQTFHTVKDAKGFTGIPFIFQDQLLYSHHQGVLLVEDSISQALISNESAIAFATLQKKPNYLLVAKVRGGLTVLERKGGIWIYKNDVYGIKDICNGLVEDKNGNFWYSDYRKGIYKIQLNEALDSLSSTTLFNEKNGLPPYSRTSIIQLNKTDELLFNTSDGIYKFVEKDNRFISEEKLNQFLFKKTYIHSIVQDSKENIWFLQFGNVGFSFKNPQNLPKIDTNFFYKLRRDVLTHITPLDEDNILFGTQKGLFHFTLKNTNHPIKSFATRINCASVFKLSGKDSLIFGGAFVNSNQAASLLQNENEVYEFQYSFNNIKFTFSALWYEDTEQTKYSYFLEGLDESWAEWSRKTEKNYTNLPEGTYTFYVKALNIYQKESKIASFQFKILPPWHRTKWAYAAYFILFILLLIFLIRANSIRLRRRNVFLKKEIAKGLTEIQQKNKELQQKNSEIEQAYQDIKLLEKIGKDITSNLAVDKIADAVYENINKLMDASVFGIGIYNPTNHTIDFIGTKEKSETLPSFSFRLSDHNRLAVWCFNHKRDVFVNDFEVEYTKYFDELQKAMIGEQTSSLMYVPLISQKNAIGIITVQSFQKKAYSHYQLNILKNVAIHTTIALENAAAYQRLAELNQEKNHLIGIVAHDLRNPLHHIYGLATVIQMNGDTLTNKQADYLNKIIDSTARVNAMIGKILDMNAIESEKINLKLEPLNLWDVLLLVKENFAAESKRKNIQIGLMGSDADYPVCVDKNYTFQIFENLLSNALKFSEMNSLIKIELMKENNKIRTAITDQGPGIREDEIPKLFGKFQKLSTKPTGGEHSTGLGLSIVKKYVELMQGNVWCESQIGLGTTFFVEFNRYKKDE